MDSKGVVALAAIAVASVGVAYGKPPTRPTSVEPTYYVDATGKTVGPLAFYGVSIRLDGYVFKLSIRQRRIESNGIVDDSYVGWYEEDVYFEQAGCAGDPYVGNNQDSEGQVTYGAVVRGSAEGDYTLYVGDRSKGRQLTVMSSIRDGVCNDLSPYAWTTTLYPVVATYDWGAMFKLPLRPK